MDVEKLLAKASENLSVRRAFGTGYEKDGMLIIPVALVAAHGPPAPQPDMTLSRSAHRKIRV